MKTFEISILRAFYFSLTCPTSASSSSHPTHSLITRMTLGSLNSDIPEIPVCNSSFVLIDNIQENTTNKRKKNLC